MPGADRSSADTPSGPPAKDGTLDVRAGPLGAAEVPGAAKPDASAALMITILFHIWIRPFLLDVGRSGC
jgi:hypothetical protein